MASLRRGRYSAAKYTFFKFPSKDLFYARTFRFQIPMFLGNGSKIRHCSRHILLFSRRWV
jgi:hypothetical protein